MEQRTPAQTRTRKKVKKITLAGAGILCALALVLGFLFGGLIIPNSKLKTANNRVTQLQAEYKKEVARSETEAAGYKDEIAKLQEELVAAQAESTRLQQELTAIYSGESATLPADDAGTPAGNTVPTSPQAPANAPSEGGNWGRTLLIACLVVIFVVSAFFAVRILLRRDQDEDEYDDDDYDDEEEDDDAVLYHHSDQDDE